MIFLWCVSSSPPSEVSWRSCALRFGRKTLIPCQIATAQNASLKQQLLHFCPPIIRSDNRFQAKHVIIHQKHRWPDFFQKKIQYLTRNGGGNFWMHPKIWCLNFKPQYLQNYLSLTNDLYSIRKRSIRAFKSIFKLLGWGPASALAPDFAPKLCTRGVSGCSSACFKTC